MNPEIFREYDIRGIAGKDLTADDVLLIGKGVGTFLKAKRAFKADRRSRLSPDFRALLTQDYRRFTVNRM